MSLLLANHLNIKHRVNWEAVSDWTTIYSQNTWANTSDFVNSGSTVSVVSNKLQFSGGLGTFTQTLGYNWYTGLEKYYYRARFTVGTKNGSSFGFGIGTRSTNVNFQYNIALQFLMYTGTDNGKIILYGNTTQLHKSATALTFSVSDVIEVTLERRENLFIATAKNITTASAEITAFYTFNTTGSAPYLPNTGRFCIYSFGGTFTLQEIEIVNRETTNYGLMSIGDSKTVGYNVTAIQNRYAWPLGAIVNAGGSDTTADVVNKLPEIVRLNPKQVLLAIGSNDKRFGIADATAFANYTTITTTLQAEGIRVLHLLPFPETAQNLTDLKNFIQGAFSSSDIIDTFDISLTLASDGVHPTDADNATIVSTIQASDKLIDSQYPNVYFFPRYYDTDISTLNSITITSNESMRKTDGTTLTSANVADIIVLKQTNSAGADIPFTATIDGTKKIISVTATGGLTSGQPVYCSINNFEDDLGNENTVARTLIFTPGLLVQDLAFATLANATKIGTEFTSTTGTTWGATGLDAKNLPADGFFEFRIGSNPDVVGIGWNTSNSNQNYLQWERGLFISSVDGTIVPVYNTGIQASTGQVAALNSRIRLVRDISNVVTIAYAADGFNYTTIYTFPSTQTGTLYFNFMIAFNGGVFYDPKGKNVV